MEQQKTIFSFIKLDNKTKIYRIKQPHTHALFFGNPDEVKALLLIGRLKFIRRDDYLGSSKHYEFTPDPRPTFNYLDHFNPIS